MAPENKLKWIVLLLIVVILSGTVGYMVIERWSFLDSLYMTVSTLSMVGFGEVYPLSQDGKIFTIILIIVGVSGAVFSLTVIGQIIIEGEIRRILGRRKMEKQLKSMRDHYIVCGYGRVGVQVCNELKMKNLPLVVIEKNPDRLEECLKQHLLAVQGDATDDDVLMVAGIQRAKAMISTVATESENVLVVISAHQLNPDIFVTARAESKSSEKKLMKAGADRVVCPQEMGGLRMAMVTIRPDVVDFMRIVTGDRDTGFGIEEIEIKENSPMANLLLKDTPIRDRLGLLVIGIKKRGKEMEIGPSAQTKIEVGDNLVVIGELQKLDELGKMTAPVPS